MLNWMMLLPQHSGYYWHAKKAEDWDLAVPVPVSRIENPVETYFEAYVDNRWQRVADVGGVWAGPFYKPMHRPEWL
jgi:hypothetical protein